MKRAGRVRVCCCQWRSVWSNARACVPLSKAAYSILLHTLHTLHTRLHTSCTCLCLMPVHTDTDMPCKGAEETPSVKHIVAHTASGAGLTQEHSCLTVQTTVVSYKCAWCTRSLLSPVCLSLAA